MSRPWQVDFVAVSVALGEPMSAVAEALGDDGMLRAKEIVRALDSPERSARVEALAGALARVATDLQRQVLA